MSSLPPPIESFSTEELRQRLAGLIDHQAESAANADQSFRSLAVRFCASLPMVFGDSLERLKMWDKIANAIQSAYAKTVDGDIDLFVQQVLESIQAEVTAAICCEPLTDAIDQLHAMSPDDRQRWCDYLATHLTPILVFARREHKDRIAQ